MFYICVFTLHLFIMFFCSSMCLFVYYVVVLFAIVIVFFDNDVLLFCVFNCSHYFPYCCNSSLYLSEFGLMCFDVGWFLFCLIVLNCFLYYVDVYVNFSFIVFNVVFNLSLFFLLFLWFLYLFYFLLMFWCCFYSCWCAVLHFLWLT